MEGKSYRSEGSSRRRQLNRVKGEEHNREEGGK